jgi:hypothetical protein
MDCLEQSRFKEFYNLENREGHPRPSPVAMPLRKMERSSLVTLLQHEIDATLQSVRQKRQFAAALAGMLLTLSLIAIGFLSSFLKITPAYAKGTTQIVIPADDPKIVFTSADTSDPGRQADFGLNQHVGRCTASLHKGVVDFIILNGYPGYQCTLSFGLANKGKSAAVLQDVEVESAPALQVYAINTSSGAVLQPGGEMTENFMLQIMPQAEENMGYPVSIHLFFMAAPDVQAIP